MTKIIKGNNKKLLTRLFFVVGILLFLELSACCFASAKSRDNKNIYYSCCNKMHYKFGYGINNNEQKRELSRFQQVILYDLHDYARDKIIIEEEGIENNGRLIRDLSLYEDKKFIVLTFDDGPNEETTLRLLDGLKENNARATFFVLGSRARQYPDIIKRMHVEGHTIASHTYSHRNLVKLSDYELGKEVDRANEVITEITGAEVRFLRPPYGSYNNRVLNKVDMRFILWNVDTLDWKFKDVEYISRSIINGSQRGNIILLHDIYKESVDAALMVIEKLNEEGYLFVSLEELEEAGEAIFYSNTFYRQYTNIPVPVSPL